MAVRLRYSLRTLTIFVIASATALGIWSRRSHEQARLVRRAEFAQFEIEYGPAFPSLFGFTSRALARIESALGKDWVCVPLVAEATSYCEYAEDFRDLCALRTLRSVHLTGTVTDDDALSMIAGLRRLEILRLDATMVTDVGLSTLDRCTSLRELELDLSLVSPDGVKIFQARHPRCKVSYKHSSKLNEFEHQRYETLHADRVPTPAEARKLELTTRLIEERDKHRQYELLYEELWLPDPEFQPPKPGTQLYRQREIQILTRPDYEYQQNAASILGKLGLAAAIPYIERVARNATDHQLISAKDYQPIRADMVRSLSHIADRRVIPILIDLLDDPSPEVASMAWTQLMLATGSPLDRGHRFDRDPASDFRRNLSARWRRFWAENGDLIRPRRAPTFQSWGGGY